MDVKHNMSIRIKKVDNGFILDYYIANPNYEGPPVSGEYDYNDLKYRTQIQAQEVFAKESQLIARLKEVLA